MSDHETSPHRLHLENRRRLTLSGVDSVESFDESSILLTTSQGALAIRGADLHIEKLSLDGGELRVEGSVDSLLYEDDGERRGGSLLARLFG